MKNFTMYLGAFAFLMISLLVYNCSKMTNSIRGNDNKTTFLSEITAFDVSGKDSKQLLLSSVINDITLTYEARQKGAVSTTSLKIDINTDPS